MYKLNPKMITSGLLDCIPQIGKCPIKCWDCYFNNRSYLEPLEENLPNIPSKELSKGQIIRMNAGGNDSNNQRELVEEIAQHYDNYFFNTSIPKDLDSFSGPVVLTLNPVKMTDNSFHKLDKIPNNLMFVRIRTNTWNLENVVIPAIEYYFSKNVMCILTFMAYYTQSIPENHQQFYTWKQRTTNSYWCLKSEKQKEIIDLFVSNCYVDSCTKKVYSCRFCGVCLREFYACKERIKNG